MKIKTETCKFVRLTTLVPKKWSGWFYDQISTDAPFSWGDNNRTLVTANRLADHAEECFESYRENDVVVVRAEEKEIEKWLAGIRKMGNTYIDLEN